MCDLHARDDQQAAQPVRVTDFVDELVVALTGVRIYDPAHPRVREMLARLRASLDELLEGTGREEIELGAVDGYLVFDRRPLLAASLSAARLLEPLARMECGGLAFARGTSEEELRALAHLLGRRLHVANDRASAEHELQEAGCRNVRLLPPYRLPGSGEDRNATLAELLAAWGEDATLASAPRLDVPVKLYQRVVENLQDVMVRVCRGEPVGLETSRTLVDAMLRNLALDPTGLLDLARYERYDAFTFGHSIRVCLLALDFARTLTTDGKLLHKVGLSALMHDVGKAWVPFEILHSVTRLSDEERREMSRHTLHGGRILLGMDAQPTAVAAAFGHHRIDQGGGYPSTLHEVRLSSTTRIVKICDVYEALTAVRPYKEPMSPTRAYRIMLSMRDHFDLPLLRRFIEVNGIYPAGSHVRLASGELARVVGQSSIITHPRVLLEQDAEGQPLQPDPERVIDLSQPSERSRRTVVELFAQHGDDAVAPAA